MHSLLFPAGQIDPPTLSMVFSPNTSPLAGREGSQLTGARIGERLQVGGWVEGSLGRWCGVAADSGCTAACRACTPPSAFTPLHPTLTPPMQAEAETNVSLRVMPVEGSGGESFEVQARGELQLGLLIGGWVREARGRVRDAGWRRYWCLRAEA